jgi:ABC-2 type transport system permease protein
MNPNQVFKIARREFLARVRTRAFIIMTILVPASLVAYVTTVPRLAGSRATAVTIAVLDAGTGLGPALAERARSIERPHVTVADTLVVDPSAVAGARQTLNNRIRSRAIDGYVLVEPSEAKSAKVRYVAREVGNVLLMRELRLAAQSALLDRLLAGSGVDVAAVNRAQRLDIDSTTVTDRGEQTGGFNVALASTLSLAMLLYMAVLINGAGMAMAIVEEKSSRLVEVILGSVTAGEFMAGKILGVMASGLLQLGIWIVVAVAIVVPAVGVSVAMSGVDLASIITPRLLFYYTVFFVLGYALYSILFAVLAATCTSTVELSQTQMLAILPMVVALLITINVIANPATTATRVFSLFPLFTPLVMMARVNVLMPPLWEVWLGIALLAATALAAAWAAAKIFRYALLMTGKRPNLPELLAVVRAR